jgi:tetratricopeptide (TPR) repeat protein
VDPAERWPDIASFVAAIERPPRRRTVVTAALAGFGVAAIAAFALAPGSRGADSECALGAERVDQVWNPIARTGLTAELVRAAPDGALARSTTRIVDHWAGAWRASRRAACTAGEHRPARLACLDHQLGELRGQLAAWSTTSADHAVSAAAALPAASACDTAADSPFRVQPVVMRIGELKTLWRSGRSAEALPKVPALLRDAEALGHHDTLATALVLASTIETETQAGAASEHANRAAIEASKAGDDAVLYAALVLQAYARIDAGQPGDALGICDAAEALAARGVPDPEKALIARGGALMRLGRTPEAIAQYHKAIAMIEPASKTDPIARISLGVALGGLGNAYLESRDPEHAAVEQRRALALQEVDYGPNHPEVARTLHDLAQAEASLHDFASATVHFRRDRAILVAAYGAKHPEVGEADVALANVAVRQGRIDEARALFHEATTELTGVLPPTHQIFAVVEGQLGSLEQNADHAGAAIPHYEKAYAILLANHVGGDELAGVEVDLAACLLDQNRLVDAKTRAEDAIEQLSRAGAPEAERAMPLAILALTADAKGDRAQAITLARQVMALTTDDDSGQRSQARTIIRDKLRAWTATAR